MFCICDAAAIGLINRFTERGLKVPDDISVTGFDDITIASLVSPSLTTIASNKVRRPMEL